MKETPVKRKMLVILVIAAALLLVGAALAAPNLFSLPWWTVDGGGGTSQGGGFSVSGTIGQPDAGPSMSGGDFTVVGGFWGVSVEVPAATSYVYLPLVIR